MEVINILPKFAQWETIPYAADFACQECGKSAIQGKDEYGNQTKEKPNLVGWCDTEHGFMAVFECPKCFTKYRFHISTTGRYDKDRFYSDFALLLHLYNEHKKNK